MFDSSSIYVDELNCIFVTPGVGDGDALGDGDGLADADGEGVGPTHPPPVTDRLYPAQAPAVPAVTALTTSTAVCAAGRVNEKGFGFVVASGLAPISAR
jgi:hypothetical protein